MKKFTALEKFRILDPLLQEEQTLAGAEALSGVPTRTLRSWKKRFLQDGL